MKKSKGIILVLGILSLLLITGCSKGESSKASGHKYTIGINQLMDHKALDDARLGLEDGLRDLGVDAKIIYKNAQGDLTNAISISKKFVDEDVDLIYALGTPAAQATKQATSDIPVLFSAVTDPVEAGLVKDWESVGGNISGTSDMAPVKEQLELFKSLDDSIENIGIIYNTGEANSQVQLNLVNEYAKDLGLNIITAGITDLNDLAQNLEHLLSKVDGLYVLSDNMIASSVSLLNKKLLEKNIISICAEESQVAGGILLTKGLSYYDLGKQTAQMAKRILIDGESIENMPVELSEKQELKVNMNTLEALGLSLEHPSLKGAVDINK